MRSIGKRGDLAVRYGDNRQLLWSFVYDAGSIRRPAGKSIVGPVIHQRTESRTVRTNQRNLRSRRAGGPKVPPHAEGDEVPGRRPFRIEGAKALLVEERMLTGAVGIHDLNGGVPHIHTAIAVLAIEQLLAIRRE